MTGKDILLATLQNKPADRTPWVPFAGTHAGQLINVPADQYLKSADNIVAGLTAAKKHYQPDGLPIVFDLQMEAEVLGCELHWAEDGPPSVCSHPLGSGTALADLPVFSIDQGRIPIALEASKRMSEAIGNDTALYGLICGPFTLAMHLWGNDLFLAMFDDPEGVAKVLELTRDVGKQMAAAYLDAGCDVIAVVDPMVSQISADDVNTWFTPYADPIFDLVREKGGLSSVFVCGDATRNLEALCATRGDNISVDENVDLAKLRDVATKAGKSFGGNIRLTVALLLGDEPTCRADTLRCFDEGGKEGFVLAPGCDLPYAVPAANLEAVAELVHSPYRTAVTATANEDDFADIVIPDYANESKVVVDIITLDSRTCPPCQYMVGAVEQAKGVIGDAMDWAEHKVTGRDGLAYMTKLGVTNIPTICIDGVPAYVSRIPDGPTLIKAIEEARDKKAASV